LIIAGNEDADFSVGHATRWVKSGAGWNAITVFAVGLGEDGNRRLTVSNPSRLPLCIYAA
jgi:hypothetical protein